MNRITPSEFKDSLSLPQPPSGLNDLEKALWYAGKGEWERAHHIVQDMNEPLAARIHGFLHRQEGDLSNAGYWYEKSGSPYPAVSLDEEWVMLVGICFR